MKYSVDGRKDVTNSKHHSSASCFHLFLIQRLTAAFPEIRHLISRLVCSASEAVGRGNYGTGGQHAVSRGSQNLVLIIGIPILLSECLEMTLVKV